jgi:hypothetical protein
MILFWGGGVIHFMEGVGTPQRFIVAPDDKGNLNSSHGQVARQMHGYRSKEAEIAAATAA